MRHAHFRFQIQPETKDEKRKEAKEAKEEGLRHHLTMEELTASLANGQSTVFIGGEGLAVSTRLAWYGREELDRNARL